jgi:hypothetical protein
MGRIIGRVVVVLSVGAIGLNLLQAPLGAKPPPKPKSTTATTQKKKCCGVGDSGMTSGFKVTVYGVTDPQPPAFQVGSAPLGLHFVSVDVQVANPSRSSKPFSSLFGLHLLDSNNRSYNEALIVGLQPAPPNGQVPPEGALRASLASRCLTV